MGYFGVVGGILDLWIQQLSVSDTTESFLGVLPSGCDSQVDFISFTGVFPRWVCFPLGCVPMRLMRGVLPIWLVFIRGYVLCRVRPEFLN